MPKPGSEYREGLSTSIFGGREDKEEIRESFTKARGEFALDPKTIQAGNKGSLSAHRGGSFCQPCGAWRGELGSEPTPELYVEHLVQVFREVWRVLRKDGTCWINLGDSYASGKGTCFNPGGGESSLGQDRKAEGVHPLDRGSVTSLRECGLKPKDLCGMPWRLAFALQADGWWLRSDIIWAKPNPMPESCTDRPTKSHEYVFLLTKSAKYYYDATAVKEPNAPATVERGKYHWCKPGNKASRYQEHNGLNRDDQFPVHSSGRNLRTVWTIPTEANPLAHFATFPRRLVEPCILAGSSERGVCPSCGAPWARAVEKQSHGSWHDHSDDAVTGQSKAIMPNHDYLPAKTTAWRPTCSCPAADPVPAIVLDPFSGTGTTGIVAVMHGRAYVGLELNREYLKMSLQRIRADCGMLAQIETEVK